MTKSKQKSRDSSGPSKDAPAISPDEEGGFSFRQECDESWDKLCTFVSSLGPVGEFVSDNVLRRLVVNAPVILGFTVACIILHIITACFWGEAARYFGCPDTFKPSKPMAYVRLVTHVFGHSGYGHLKGNMVNLLMVGPSAEHHFGSRHLVFIFSLVAVSSGIAHVAIGRSRSIQLGASGIVFAMILLNSLVSATYGTIPVTFAITALLWISDEVWKLFFSGDGVSHHAHLTGAVVGLVAGYAVHKKRHEEKAREVAEHWLETTRSKTAAKGRNWWAGTKQTATKKKVQ